MSDEKNNPAPGFDTLAVRAGALQSNFQEHSEALFLTSSFTYKNAAEAARKFANEEPGFLYSRFTNPTVTMFQDRLAALEGAEACTATATGMAAIASTVLGLLKQGDHIVASRSVFGTVVPLFNQICKRFGIDTTWVDPTNLDAWRIEQVLLTAADKGVTDTEYMEPLDTFSATSPDAIDDLPF